MTQSAQVWWGILFLAIGMAYYVRAIPIRRFQAIGGQTERMWYATVLAIAIVFLLSRLVSA
jgi:hypothetical protein